MNDKGSQLSVMNNIVNGKKGHNIVNVSFAHEPEDMTYHLSCFLSVISNISHVTSQYLDLKQILNGSHKILYSEAIS